ncbi:hypothetical protein DEQ92_21365, partial [Haloferax sp. Atlit-6N]
GQNNHLWLEVLEGDDVGIRVSVPRYSRAYDEELQEQVLDLDTGDVHEFILESEETTSPNWRIATIDPAEEQDRQTPVTA